MLLDADDVRIHGADRLVYLRGRLRAGGLTLRERLLLHEVLVALVEDVLRLRLLRCTSRLLSLSCSYLLTERRLSQLPQLLTHLASQPQTLKPKLGAKLQVLVGLFKRLL